ncbi:5'-methylthioadenosine/S-adenosylhomocysteine nucleosidase [Gallibacterium trehalosifermentans]|uniref:5'-methylthioadenosine/S-adenosylhomocysteine nucleosidase n=1 Tax=Gallibacterium trehalosifermentans TaxID=516935 RepID=A0ABV6H0L7_9PAST
MKIGIVGAMAQEVEILQSLMKNKQEKKLATCTIYEGQIGQHNIALLQSGIGKSAAAMGTTALILTCQPDCIINTGSAGGLNPQLNIGDIIVSDYVSYHDADVTAFGYAKGQLPACPEKFSADKKLINTVAEVVHEQGKNAVIGLVCSGDQFINGQETIARIRQDFPAVAAVEMEAAAIAHICYAFNLPFVVIRAISDVADKESHISFDEFLPIAVKQSSQIVLATLEKLVN